MSAFIAVIFIFCRFSIATAEGVVEAVVQSECRDRYLWIHVASSQTPRFEAVDGNGVHAISEQLASRCGYTISSFKMDGFTSLRASYYSCFTHNQNDEVFTFKFNVMVSDSGGRWVNQLVSTVCSGLIWTNREVICEEDYMEVNVNRESSCGGTRGDSGQVWQAAFSQAQREATSVWQLMILQSDGQVSSMSISEAQRRGFSLATTARRAVLRSLYKQPHAKLTTVDGVPVEVVQASLFFKRTLMVVMMDVSMACTVNSGSFDGARLLWDVPQVVTPLVVEGARFESRSLSLGVEGVLLDQATATARGFSMVQKGRLIQIGVPFGVEGGYRKSLVVNNVYKETYVIALTYQHIFSLLYEDGSRIDTRHRMIRVLNTPQLCHPPFSLDQTGSDQQVFRIYLGNIPADVVLEDVWINGKQLIMMETTISPVIYTNGSRAYELRLPFQDSVVHWMYLGRGVVQYSVDVNFTLTIVPQRDSYFHHTYVTARLFNAFPPEITAQCSGGGITFSVVQPPPGQSLWEVGVDHEPLTSQLAAQRGYSLYNDSHRTTLEVPVFSVGYTYEDVNLSNFYGAFKLLLRDSKTLEVETSTSKRCLFRTQDMIVCSADGIMTVVTTPTSTWPSVQPGRTSLLDPTCGPKQTDGLRVLFEFKLNSCGTRAMVGESYVVYENEILHDRQMTADGPNFISRESQFKLTARCFYPLSGVNRLSVDRVVRSETPGFGSVKVFKSIQAGSTVGVQNCSHQAFGANQDHKTSAGEGVLPHTGIQPQSKPGPSHLITVPSGQNQLLSSSQSFPHLNLYPPPSIVTHNAQDQHVSTSSPGDHPPNVPPRRDHVPDIRFHLSNLNPALEGSGLTGSPDFGLNPSSKIPGSSVIGPLQTDSESSGQTLTLQGTLHTGLTRDQSIGQNQDQHSLEVDASLGIQELQHEANMYLSHHGSLGEEVPRHQPQSPPSYTSPLYPVLQPPAHFSSGHMVLPGRDETTSNIKHNTYRNDLPVDTPGSVSTEPVSTETRQVHLERPGSIERRNTQTFHSRVQNIRVKPISKFISPGYHLDHKSFVQHSNSQISDPTHASGRRTVSRDGSRWTPQHLSKHTGSTLKTEPTAHGVRILTDLSQNRQESLLHESPDRQEKLVDSVVGNIGAQKAGSTQRNTLQPTGHSHVRVRMVPGLQRRLQSHEEPRLQTHQKPTSSRTSYSSLTPQSIPNGPKYQTNNLDSDKDLIPPPGGGIHKGSGGSTSDFNTHHTPGCRRQYGASVHQGLMRGTQTRSTPQTPDVL